MGALLLGLVTFELPALLCVDGGWSSTVSAGKITRSASALLGSTSLGVLEGSRLDLSAVAGGRTGVVVDCDWETSGAPAAPVITAAGVSDPRCFDPPSLSSDGSFFRLLPLPWVGLLGWLVSE